MRAEQQAAIARKEAREQVGVRVERRWGHMAGSLLLALLVALFVGFLVLPIAALLLRVPLADLAEYAARPIVLEALKLSFFTTLVSLGLMVLLGTPVAYVLGRYRFPGKRIIETLVEIPLVMPPAVAGVALLLAFGRRGLFGPTLEGAGLDIAFSTAAVVLAQIFVASPFYVKAARSGFQSVPTELEQSAATEGAGRWAQFQHIILPLALPAIVGGAVMAWARALGEFGATILFAGNFGGRTQTMPLAIYTALETDLNAAIVLSTILIVASFALLITFKLLSGRQLDVIGMGG
ncbi:MAG TPA: ABC transporter permease [Chloroflexia bacterium]